MENNIIQTLKGKLQEYLANTGRTMQHGKNGPCPICGGSESSTRARLFDDGLGWYCWGGDCGGMAHDIFSLIGHDYGTSDFKEQVNIACQLFGFDMNNSKPILPPLKVKEQPSLDASANRITKEKSTVDFSDFYAKCRQNPEPAYEYLMNERGISREVCDAHNVGYEVESHHDPNIDVRTREGFVVIPISNGYYVKRSIKDKRFKNPSGVEVQLDCSALDQDEPVFVVEAIIDAMSIETVGGKAIALNSVSNVKLLITEIKKRTKLPFLLLALDDDAAGKKAQAELAIGLNKVGAQFTEVNLYEI